MNKRLIILPALLLCSVWGFSQLQFGASGSYLKGTGENTANKWGGGLHARGFIGKHFALGIGLRSYPKSSSSIQEGDLNITSSDLLTHAAATFDILLAKNTSAIQPYIGTDAGLSFSNRITTINSNASQTVTNDNRQTFFLLSPKAGLNIGLGRTFGIFGQVQYNYTFGEGNPINPGPIPNPIETRPVDKFWSYDAGIYVRLVGAAASRRG